MIVLICIFRFCDWLYEFLYFYDFDVLNVEVKMR